jgi:hypothetical protein
MEEKTRKMAPANLSMVAFVRKRGRGESHFLRINSEHFKQMKMAII